MNNDLIKYLSEKLTDEQKVLFDELGLGTAKDYGEYKYVCGTIRGLMIANNILAETSEKMEKFDE